MTMLWEWLYLLNRTWTESTYTLYNNGKEMIMFVI